MERKRAEFIMRVCKLTQKLFAMNNKSTAENCVGDARSLVGSAVVCHILSDVDIICINVMRLIKIQVFLIMNKIHAKRARDACAFISVQKHED